jgi:hypothetical protein
MEVFVLKSLEKLRADSSRRDTEFREAADLVIRACTARETREGRDAGGRAPQLSRV